MSIVTAKVNRSELYHTIATVRPVNDARIIQLDVWGSVIIPVLFVSVLNLVRLVFAN
ncbi:MAG: hypothetical protein ABSC01_08585 [Verrucomicrobiota bacterium]|jgi:hypothetical protein